MLKHRFRCLFTGDEGFTLIETLITVALIGLIIAAGFGIYSVGVRLYNAGQNQTTIQFELRRIAEFISDEVRLASHVELLGEVPIPEDGVTDIYFRDNNIYIRRPYNDPIVLSTQDKGQLTGLSFSSADSKLLDFELDAILGKQEYDIKSAVLPLNLQGDIKVGDNFDSKFIAVRLGQVGGGFDGVLFASDEIDIHDGILTGEVFTNGTVNFGSGGQIKGNVTLLGKSANSNTDIKIPKDSSKTHITGEITTQLVERAFSLPHPVDIPTPSKKGALEYDWNNILPPLTESGWYDAITVSNKMEIKVGNQDIHLRVDKLEVSGKVIISRTGAGIVKLYVNDFVMSGSGSINQAGDPSKLEIYYTGNKQLEFGNSFKISGKIDLGHMGFEINGGSPVTGSVITRSTGKITISNAGKFIGLLYAPKAEVTMTGSGYLEGQLICKSLDVSNGAELKYNSTVIPQGIKLN